MKKETTETKESKSSDESTASIESKASDETSASKESKSSDETAATYESKSADESKAEDESAATDENVTDETDAADQTIEDANQTLISDTTKTLTLNVKFIDEEGNDIPDTEDDTITVKGSLNLTKAPKAVRGYNYVEARFGDTVITKITRVTEEKSTEDEKTADADVKEYSYEYTAKDGTTGTIDEGSEINLVYAKADHKCIYTYVGNGIRVTAKLENSAAIPDDTSLQVTELTSGELYDAYIAAMDEAEPEVEHTKSNTIVRDISFIAKDENGQEIEYEPTEGSVKVSIKYLGDKLEKKLGVADVSEVKTYHLPFADGIKAEGEKTIDVKNVKSSDIKVEELDSKIEDEKTVEVELESFSGVVQTVSLQDETSIDLSQALQTAVIFKVNGEEFDSSKKYPRDANIEFKLTYKFSESYKPTAGGTHTATYILPEGLEVSDTSGSIDGGKYTSDAGSYKIENKKVTFTYTDGFLEAHPSSIDGTFKFTGKISSTESTNKEYAEITFTGNSSSTPVRIYFEEGKINGNKGYTLNSDGTIDFKITFSVTGKDVTNVVLTDTLGSNLEFEVSPQFKLGGEDIENSKININGKVATLKLGDLAVGNYEITYKAKLTDKSIASGDTNKNTASWTWNENGNSKAETTVSFAEKFLKKSASYTDGEYPTITWTIIYVPGTFGSVASKTFTDVLGQDQKYDGNYAVYYDEYGNRDSANGTQIETGALPETGNFSYTFATDRTQTKGAYKIVYKTKVTKTFTDKQTFTNTVSGDEMSAEGSQAIDHKLDCVSKRGKSNNDTKMATWTINVKVPTGKSVTDLKIEDELQNQSTWNGKYKQDSVVVKEGTAALKKDSDYMLNFTESGKMIIEFKKIITADVTISYEVDYSGWNETSAWAEAKNQITSTYKVDGVKNTEIDNGKVQFSTWTLEKNGKLVGGVADWTIVINKDKNPLTGFDRKIVDTIPAGMEYVENSLTCTVDSNYWDAEYKKDWNEATVSYDKAANKLEINLNKFDTENRYNDKQTKIVLSYKTKIVNVPTVSGNGATVDGDKVLFTNSVDVSGKKTSDTVELNSRELDKKGVQIDGKSVVKYTLGINYGGRDLNQSGDTLTLIDELSQDLVLDTRSLSVKDMNTGEEVSYKSSFGTSESGGNKITLTIPDGRALIVEYSASLNTAGKTIGSTYNVSNKAVLKGTVEKETSISTDVKFVQSSATIEGKSNSITIEKVDPDGNSLSGAKFIVQKVIPASLADYGNPIIKVTDGGTAEFDGLELNNLYYYQETEAPENYQITDGSKNYFIIADKSSNERINDFNNLTTSIKSGTDFKVLNGGNTFIIENQPITNVGTLNLTKSFDSYTVTDKDLEKITFTVTRKDDNGDTVYTNKIKLKDMDKQSDGSYTKTLDNLTLGNYEVTENANEAAGYTRTVSYKVTKDGATASGDTVATTNRDGTSTIKDIAVEKDKTTTVDIKNSYSEIKTTGSLTFTKSFAGDNITSEDLEKISFTVKKVEGEDEKVIGTYLLKDIKTNDGYVKTMTGLESGEYTVTENNATFEAYTLKKSFKVDGEDKEAAKGTVVADSNLTIDITNTYTYKDHKVTISKTNVGGTEIEGAKLKVTDKDGNVVQEWTSTTTEKSFTVQPGTYVLHEVAAPNGYEIANDIEFKVAVDGTVTVDGKTVDKITMVDYRTGGSNGGGGSGNGGGGGGGHKSETTKAETSPSETTQAETDPIARTEPTYPDNTHETDEYGNVIGANRGKKSSSEDETGEIEGVGRHRAKTGDDSMMRLFGVGFVGALILLLAWAVVRMRRKDR